LFRLKEGHDEEDVGHVVRHDEQRVQEQIKSSDVLTFEVGRGQRFFALGFDFGFNFGFDFGFGLQFSVWVSSR
jgi:hypothetical protein